MWWLIIYIKQRRQMETSHEIPKGLAFESIKSEEVQPIPSHISE